MLNVKRCLSLSVSALALSAGTSLAAGQNNVALFPASILDTNNTHIQVQSSAPFRKLASACFVTDISDCQGQKYGGTEDYPTLPPDEYIPKPNKDKCLELGFNLTTCSEGYAPYKYCPYDSHYFRECVCAESCPEGYRQELCSGAEKQQDMKVQNCTVCYKCGAYDDTCPAGYVKTKVSSKCYETTTQTTEAGSICYKEKACCSDICSGYTSIPSASICKDGYDTVQICGKDCYTCKDCTCSGYTSAMSAMLGCGGKGYTSKNICGVDCYICNKCKVSTCDKSFNLSAPDTGGGKTCANCTPQEADCSAGTTVYKCSCPEGYAWKEGMCKEERNGPDGNFFYCDNAIVGVKVSGMNFWVGNNNGFASWDVAGLPGGGACSGELANTEELLMMYNNKNALNQLLTGTYFPRSSRNGEALINGEYLSSSPHASNFLHYTVSMTNGEISALQNNIKTNIRQVYR